METASFPLCSSALLSRWIVKFGIPEHIISDRGTSFTSQLWTSLWNFMEITLHQTTAYSNSAANRMVERCHKTLRAALISHYKDFSWFTQLPWVILRLRTPFKEALDISPTDKMYGDQLVIPAQFLAHYFSYYIHMTCGLA
ncbi:uncharacterized protein [Palaemon carinicauda]|uniref:uncharacterized protein n=1 Tax=Palaemon carinicauda TaxID=392227 RepID=UPI0035B63747